MALTPLFSVTQTAGLPNKLTITDDSVGSDVAIISRLVYLITATGTYLVQTGTTTNYERWVVTQISGVLTPLSITLAVLLKDMALQIRVVWCGVSDVPLYSLTKLYGLTLYNETFDYGLTQMLTANPPLMNESNFRENKSNLRTLIDSGNQAVTLASDLYGAQQCYDAATELRLNSQYSFNINS